MFALRVDGNSKVIHRPKTKFRVKKVPKCSPECSFCSQEKCDFFYLKKCGGEVSAVSLGPSYICIQSTTHHVLDKFPKENDPKAKPDTGNSNENVDFCFYGYKPRSRTNILQPTQVEIKYFPLGGCDETCKASSSQAQKRQVLNS